jgi:hypothetical protein
LGLTTVAAEPVRLLQEGRRKTERKTYKKIFLMCWKTPKIAFFRFEQITSFKETVRWYFPYNYL